MSEKLPVGETLNEAFQFGLKRWGTVIRYGWAAFVIAILAFAAYAMIVVGATVFTAANNGADIKSFQDLVQIPVVAAIGLAVILYVFVAVLFCGVVASLYRLVVLGEDSPGIFHLRLDGPALRVFFSFLIIGIINAVIWCAALAISFAINGQEFADLGSQLVRFFQLAVEAETGEVSDAEVLSVVGAIFRSFALAVLIAFIPLIYLNIKLIPFPPGSAAENRLLLFGSFGMTTGHFWSIFGIYILFIIFVIILSVIFQIVLAILQALAALGANMGGAAAIVGAVVGLIVLAAGLFFNIFLFGAQTALRAIIYRRLATGA